MLIHDRYQDGQSQYEDALLKMRTRVNEKEIEVWQSRNNAKHLLNFMEKMMTEFRKVGDSHIRLASKGKALLEKLSEAETQNQEMHETGPLSTTFRRKMAKLNFSSQSKYRKLTLPTSSIKHISIKKNFLAQPQSAFDGPP